MSIYLLFTGITLVIAAVRFFTFVEMDPLMFVDGLSKVGLITLISGIFGLFLDQASLNKIGRGLNTFALPYGLTLLLLACILLYVYYLEKNSFALIISQSCMLAVCLVSRGACASGEKLVLHQTLSVTYGLYIFLITLTHTELIGFDLYISALLAVFALIELLASNGSWYINDLQISNKSTVSNIKSHFIGYFLVFVSMKIMEYIDKFYCDYFGCGVILANYVKVASLLFAAAGIVWSSIVNKSFVSGSLRNHEKVVAIMIYIPLSAFVIYKNAFHLMPDLATVAIISSLIILSNLCQELRIREIYHLENSDRSTKAFGYSAIKAGALAFIPIMLALPFYSYSFYLISRYVLFLNKIRSQKT